MLQIAIGGQTIVCHVQYGPRKKISIQLEPNGMVVVKAPNKTSDDVIRALVQQHGERIIAQQRAMEQARALPQLHDYTDEGKFLYLGAFRPLRELIEINGLDEGQRRQELKTFYIASCKKIVAARIKPYLKQLNAKPKTIDIVESSTRWGSCSSDKQLTFNYLLAMAPVEVIDYVIIHELCHLTHMNHDRSFWRLVGSVMPDYKEKEAFLEKYARLMTL